jgi:hypothetical protein
LVRRKWQIDISPLLARLGLLGVTRTDRYLVACSAEGLGEGRSDCTRSENGNLHGDIMTTRRMEGVGMAKVGRSLVVGRFVSDAL